MLCQPCESLLQNLSTHASTDDFLAYLSTRQSRHSCAMCAFFWWAAGKNHSLRSVIGDRRIGLTSEEQYDLKVSLYSASSGTVTVLLQAVGPVGPITGEHIIISNVFERQTDEEQRTSTLEFLKSQLRECLESHNCSPYSGDNTPLLPTRVIDVGPPGSPEELHLYETNGARGNYIALSHCWGTPLERQFTTTSDSLARMISGIPITALPKTFADAVSITRALGLRYLWIDSVCILQDNDKEDWKREASKMAAVYQNAHMTIAAASATDGEGGCFPSRVTPYSTDPNALKITFEERPPDGEARRFQPHFLMRVATNLAEVVSAYSKSPISQRAWVLQEMTLSPRIAFFAQDQTFWMCAQCVASEDGIYKEINSVIRRPTTITFGLQNTSEGTESFVTARVLATTHIQLWYDLVEDYSRRRLSFASDKLVALAGMTTHFTQEMDPDKPAVGLWESDLRNGVLWLPHTGQISERVAGVPSWSWASFNGPVMFPHRYMQAEILRTSDDMEFSQVDIRWTGVALTSSLQQSSLRVKGLIAGAKCTVVQEEEIAHRNRYPFQWARVARPMFSLLINDTEFIGGAVFDGEPLLGNRDLTFLNISLVDGGPGADTFRRYHNTLLVECEEEGCYRRLGAAFVTLNSGIFTHISKMLFEMR